MSNVTPFPLQTGQGSGQGSGASVSQTGFDRLELQRIMDLYGRMVAAGHWRDYAIDMGREAAIFSAFRRAAERPEFRIEKRPSLRHRQGMWALIGEAGHVLKRGAELQGILAPVERRLLKIVGD
ncbi:DUF2794 domain-containing protein [Sphingobium sp. JS3065]|jgi:hypothetical protein|uniref:DUF2794 domain-containing protein n=1 Tax=Sphingobium sp. JS3065 TaxID=2970925 RepID=UPI0022655AA3|nr:DUF2794 domain-containing protein [Sphingobium sp. JS3065]UZW55875.1 DUF2794 domain-containing protein [Sphingobium sp. JS3065]